MFTELQKKSSLFLSVSLTAEQPAPQDVDNKVQFGLHVKYKL